MERDMKGHERKMGPAEKDRRGGRSKHYIPWFWEGLDEGQVRCGIKRRQLTVRSWG